MCFPENFYMQKIFWAGIYKLQMDFYETVFYGEI